MGWQCRAEQPFTSLSTQASRRTVAGGGSPGEQDRRDVSPVRRPLLFPRSSQLGVSHFEETQALEGAFFLDFLSLRLRLQRGELRLGSGEHSTSSTHHRGPQLYQHVGHGGRPFRCLEHR